MIKDTNILEVIKSEIILDAIKDFITDANIPIDSGHFEARDHAHSKKKINPGQKQII